jgi:hypothetical protein
MKRRNKEKMPEERGWNKKNEMKRESKRSSKN